MDLAGAERNLFEIVTRLDKSRFIPAVFALQAGTIIGDLNKKGIKAENLRLKRIYGIKAVWEGLKLISFIRKNNVKIVVTYHESSDFWGAIIAKLAGVPVIISSRRDMGYRLKKRHIIIYRFINNLFDMIITVSDAVKNVIFDRENALWCKLKTIHNGVDLEKFSKSCDAAAIKKSLGLELDKPIVGILAALRPIKGHQFFIEAASMVLKEQPNTRFLIVGWYDEKSDYYKELKELINKLGITDKVIFTGGRSDTPEIISIMDISVFSSINEGFSNAVLESMAAGKPVIATDSGGTSEAVIDGVTGILVPPRNPETLANAMLKLLEGKNLAEAMGKAARKRVAELFSLDKMIGEILNLYNDVLKEKTYREKITVRINMGMIIKQSLRLLKLSLSVFLYYTRLLTLFEKIIPDNKGIKVLAYHRINNNDFDPLGMNIRVKSFEKQMRFIKRHYKLISLQQAVELLRSHQSIPDNTIVVTFDDGYKDNYINAYPILKKYNIPADIFLSAGAIEKKQILWFEAIIASFKQTSKKCIDLTEIGLKRYKINTVMEKMDNVQEIVSFAKNLSKEDREKMIVLLLEKLDLANRDLEFESSMLEWEDIREMKKNGIDFGSHGLNHSILSRLSEKEAEKEIGESKKIIQERVNSEVKFFTYPNGGAGDFNERIISLLKKNNFLAACTLVRGSNNRFSNLYSLKRFCVNRGMESGVFSNFSKSLFALEMSGLLRVFKTSYGG